MNTADLTRWLVRHLADYLARPVAEIDPTAALRSYGVDSVYALTLAADLADTFDVLVGPDLTWDHPTLDAIAGHLAAHLRPAP